MSELQSWSIRRKMIVGFAAIAILVVVSILTMANWADLASKEWKDAEQKQLWAFQLHQLRETIGTQRTESLAMLTAPSPQQIIMEVSIRQRSQEIDRILLDFRDRCADDPDLAGKLKELSSLGSSIRRREHLEILPDMRNGKGPQAKKLLLGVHQTEYDRVQSLAREMAEKMQNNAMQQAAAATEQTQKAQGLCVVVAILTLILSVIIAEVLIRTTPRKEPDVSPAAS